MKDALSALSRALFSELPVYQSFLGFSGKPVRSVPVRGPRRLTPSAKRGSRPSGTVRPPYCPCWIPAGTPESLGPSWSVLSSHEWSPLPPALAPPVPGTQIQSCFPGQTPQNEAQVSARVQCARPFPPQPPRLCLTGSLPPTPPCPPVHQPLPGQLHPRASPRAHTSAQRKAVPPTELPSQPLSSVSRRRPPRR